MRLLPLVVAIVALSAFAHAIAAQERYDGHVVLRLALDTSDPSRITHDQQAAYANLRNLWNLDWWSDSDVRVAPERVNDVRRFMNEHNLVHTVMIENVQKLLDQESAHHLRSSISNAPLLGSNGLAVPDFFKDYRPLDGIWSFVDSLITQYPSLVSKTQIGVSYENRPLYAVVVNSHKNATANIYFEGGIHSREWVAHTTVLYILWSLLSGYGTNPNITAMVDQYNFHINPAVNPDGYIWTWTRDRMWRKTRQPNKGSTCIGVDPNRNWDNHWCEQGADRNPCSDAYCGPAPFSEKETKAAADYVKKIGNVKAFIDFHSYSQLWMQPYGWTAAHPANYDNQRKAGLDAVAAIKRTHGLTYQEGSIYTIIYPASGSSADWANDDAGVGYPYGVELRDTGEHGFILPASQIVPCGEEILAAVQAMMAYISSH